MKKTYYLLIVFLAFSACKKDWLAEKRDISIIVPSTLTELRLLLNNEFIMNTDSRQLVESSCDDFYVTKTQFDGITIISEHNAITWSNDIYQNSINVEDWEQAYKTILYANVILDATNKIERTASNSTEYDFIKGNALFFRSRAFLNLVMTFAKSYDPATANTDLGIPLKTSADINEKIIRASVQQTYDKIAEDLSQAKDLLPISAEQRFFGSKPACYGLLARCYLYMGKYELALQAATNSYNLNPNLIDFNTLNAGAARPIPAQNAESHTFSYLSPLNSFSGYANIDEEFYNSYSENDLRKSIFYRKRDDGGIHFKGSYNGSGILNAATATDEMLLISAECKANLNDLSGAMNDLNTLLVKRFRAGTFTGFIAANKKEALAFIRRERRKELVRRGLRFQDLKRYNSDPELSTTLTRKIDGITYTLPPNDPRYVLPIPEYIIQFNGIMQNPR